MSQWIIGIRINHVLFHRYNPRLWKRYIYIYIYMCSNWPQNLACVLHGQPLTCVSTTREMIAQSTRSDMGSHMRAHGGSPQRLQRALWKEAEATVHPLDASASLLPRIPRIGPHHSAEISLLAMVWSVTRNWPQRCWPLLARFITPVLLTSQFRARGGRKIDSLNAVGI